MQWKLPKPSFPATVIHRLALKYGFPQLAKVAPKWRRSTMFWHARWIIAVVMGVYSKPKEAIKENLARITGYPASSTIVSLMTKKMLNNFAYSWVDLFHIPQLSLHKRVRIVSTTEGLENLTNMQQGGIILTAHLGCWEAASALLPEKGLKVAIVYIKDKYKEVEHFRSHLRKVGKIKEIAITQDKSHIFQIVSTLNNNYHIAMQGDRDFRNDGLPATFFGEKIKFPRGPFKVAALYKVKLIPLFVTYTRNYLLRIKIYPYISTEVNLLEEAVARWSRILTHEIRRNPTQWYTFYNYWETHRA